MNPIKIVFFVLWSTVVSTAHAEELLRTTTTWAGGDIVYPPGKAEVTSVKIKLAEGEASPFHCHPVPTLGYILKGKVEVETKAGDRALLEEGESVAEVVKTLHRGTAIDGPAEIVVFYAGAESIPNTVLAEDDPEAKYCKQ